MVHDADGIGFESNVPLAESRVLYMGVDPGASGGIAILTKEGKFVGAWKQPATERDIVELLAEFAPRIHQAHIEHVHAFPGNGPICPLCKRPKAQGTVSSFSFGENYGFLRGALTALKIPFVEVSPMKWKRAMGCQLTKDDSKTDKKNASKGLAQQMFPSVKITHAIAEAILLAEFARRQP